MKKILIFLTLFLGTTYSCEAATSSADYEAAVELLEKRPFSDLTMLYEHLSPDKQLYRITARIISALLKDEATKLNKWAERKHFKWLCGVIRDQYSGKNLTEEQRDFLSSPYTWLSDRHWFGEVRISCCHYGHSQSYWGRLKKIFDKLVSLRPPLWRGVPDEKGTNLSANPVADGEIHGILMFRKQMHGACKHCRALIDRDWPIES